MKTYSHRELTARRILEIERNIACSPIQNVEAIRSWKYFINR